MGKTKKANQLSISHFFKKSPSKSPLPPVKREPFSSQRSDAIEVIDLENGDDQDEDLVILEQTPATEPSTQPEATTPPQVKKRSALPEPQLNEAVERVQRFVFNKDTPPTAPTSDQQHLRQQYKRKLTTATFGNTTDGIDEARGSDEDEEEETPQPVKKQRKSASNLTPLDEQVKQLKLQHLDKVLAVHVGYKYKFFCEDAVKVHRLLNIMLIPGKQNVLNETPADKMYNKLAYCSIPENRLHIHLQRLLDRGLKVGIIQQTESRAIKDTESSNKSKLFKREITDVYTKATYMEYKDREEGEKDDRALDSLISIIESPKSETHVLFTVVAIQPLTGEIEYDEFEDDLLRSELETRLLHLEPIEILHFEDNLSPLTAKIIDNFTRQQSTQIRTITYPQIKRTFYETFLSGYDVDNVKLFDFTSSKSPDFQACCSLLIEYLTEFQLDSAFKIVENYTSFKEANHMALNANTLQNLEIFHNLTTFQEYGSLMWLLNHTRTKFGFRSLRRWISKPLVDRESIERRLDAVQNLHNDFHHFLESLATLMKSCPDLEKMLSRIHYGKVKRKELYIFLSKLDDISRLVIKFGRFDILTLIRSPLLKDLLERIIRLTMDLNVGELVGMINSQHAMDDRTEDYILKYFNLSKLTINQDEIVEEKMEIESIKEELQGELVKARDLFRRPSLEYTEKNREPYLIEVRNGILKIVPKDWLKINSTKTVSRFRPPRVTELYGKLKYRQELYLNACEVLYKKFLNYIDEHYTTFNDIIKSLAQYDCLLSLSAASSASNMVRPTFVDSKVVRVEKGRNPIIEQLNNYVPNDINMDEKSKCMVITGPNMGGKSSFVKKVALIVIMAQIGCFVPAESAVLGVFHSILTRMGAQDDLIKGESTFYTEMSQMLQVLNNVKLQKGNTLVILDEIGRGTGTVDGISIAGSILEYFAQDDLDALVLFITHFPSVCQLEKIYPHAIQNYHMGYIEQKTKEDDWPKVTFLYNLVKGIASNSYGLNVAKLAFIDETIIQHAFSISKKRQRQVEDSHKAVDAMRLGTIVRQVLGGEDQKLKDIHRLLDNVGL